MDATIAGLVGALLGGLIGGIGSYLGGIRGSKTNYELATKLANDIAKKQLYCQLEFTMQETSCWPIGDNALIENITKGTYIYDQEWSKVLASVDCLNTKEKIFIVDWFKELIRLENHAIQIRDKLVSP